MKFREHFLRMLEYTRPHQSVAEEAYIEEYIRPYCDYTDEFGNLICATVDNPRIMFSSHTDTVHNKSGKQKLNIHKDKVVTSDATCLGADDTVGNYLMISMIDKEIPGLYIFHRGEERGGLGSRFIAEETPDLVKSIDMAIALDRKSNNDVVQYQNGSRCCSEKFAKELASVVGMTGGDEIGSFTDTANYVDLITECSNISVGYWDQHSKRERCDLQVIAQLEDILLHADWDGLKAYGYEPEWERGYSVYTGGFSHGGYSTGFQHDPYWDLYDLCQKEPRIVAKFLAEAGITEDDILYTKMEVNGNGIDSMSYEQRHFPEESTEIQPYVSPTDRIMVDQYGRYIFK